MSAVDERGSIARMSNVEDWKSRMAMHKVDERDFKEDRGPGLAWTRE
jgi:hypothetical protein